MTIRTALPNLTLLAILALFGVASFLPLESMWGINHLAFLPTWWSYLYLLVVALVLYLMFGRLPEDRLERAVERVDGWLWGGRIWPRLVLVVLFTLLFYVCRVETHLLGDGYTWLAVFGQGEAYIHKLTEPGSIYFLRWLQCLLGGYTRETALAAFQIMSIVSGAVSIWCFISIAGKLTNDAGLRLLALSTLVFSGASLLHFGYVEFYPITWAFVAILLDLSLGCLRGTKPIWPVPVAFVLGVLMHLQVLFFLPGVAWLLVSRMKSPSLRRFGYTLFAVVGLAGIAVMVWRYNTDIAFEILILPFSTGRPPADNYTMLSPRHIVDIVSLSLLVFPGLLALLVVLPRVRWSDLRDRTVQFLGWLSLGSVSFLMLFGAAITMGRDWDIMSLSLLAPVLLLLYLLTGANWKPPIRLLTVYTLVVGVMAVSFFAVGTRTEPTEERFHTLLNHCNRNGWVIYANHFLLKGDTARFNQHMREMNRLFPEYADLARTYRCLERGDYRQAYRLANALVSANPYEPDFLQVLGNAYGKRNSFDSAEYYYHRALSLLPYHTGILNELGQLYMTQQKYDQAVQTLTRARRISPERTFITEGLALTYIYLRQLDSASALADTLFMTEPNHAGAHLIKLTIALCQNDLEAARYHYREFVAHGQGRSDYDRMREYYGYLR